MYVIRAYIYIYTCKIHTYIYIYNYIDIIQYQESRAWHGQDQTFEYRSVIGELPVEGDNHLEIPVVARQADFGWLALVPKAPGRGFQIKAGSL